MGIFNQGLSPQSHFPLGDKVGVIKHSLCLCRLNEIVQDMICNRIFWFKHSLSSSSLHNHNLLRRHAYGRFLKSVDTTPVYFLSLSSAIPFSSTERTDAIITNSLLSSL